jgi:3-oxoacyl-[acyl-carrier-protein] synthase-1
VSAFTARAGAIYVAALGASTPVGRDAWSSAAAVRAGISGFGEYPRALDSAGEPVRVAAAPWIDGQCAGCERFEALLFPAVEQALAPCVPAPADIRVALALAVPAARPGLPGDLERSLRDRIASRFSSRFTAVGTFALGHASGVVAMEAACRGISDGTFDACVVAGVESYLAPETLEWLERRDQLHGAGALNNAWGFVPGEGAGAVLLVGAPGAARLHADALARLLAVATSVEPSPMGAETVCTGEGLTAAFREALAALPPGSKVTDIFCDMNGEPYRADEFAFAALRTNECFRSASDFVAPADCWGDVGAASVPLVVALSVIASRKAYANGLFALVWASSEHGERGAVLIECNRPGT